MEGLYRTEDCDMEVSGVLVMASLSTYAQTSSHFSFLSLKYLLLLLKLLKYFLLSFSPGLPLLIKDSFILGAGRFGGLLVLYSVELQIIIVYYNL